MVNVTVLCANRPRLLKQALDSIGDLSDATVTIRDAGMNPEVCEVAHRWCDVEFRSVCYSRPKAEGTGASRNDVIRASVGAFGRGEYLYLSDDDVFFRPGWLQTLVNAYEVAWQHGFRVLGGVGHPYHHPISTLRVGPVGVGEQLNGDFVVNEVYAQPLQSMLMRWEVFDEYGPFRETPVGAVCQGEDCDFGNAIRAKGGRLGVISPALLVNCGVTNSFGQPIPGADMVRAQAPAGVIVE